MKTIRQNQKILGIIALGILTLIWGYNWIMMKSALQYMSAGDFSFLRIILGFLLLLILLKITGRSLKPTSFIPTILIGLFQTAGMTVFAQLALIIGGAGKVSIMVYTMPFWIVLLSTFMLNERMRKLQILAMIIAAGGLFFMIQPWRLENSLISSILALASGLSWAIGAVLSKQFYLKNKVDALTLTTWQMGYGSIFLMIFTLLVGEHYLINEPQLWFCIFYITVLATALAWFLWMFILKNMNASIAGLCTLIIPVIAIFFAWIQLGDIPNNYEIIGIFMILIGLIAINVNPKKRS